MGLREASLQESPKVGLELGEDRDIRSGKAVNRLPIVSDGKDLGAWFLMLERLDQVGPRIRDILEFIDENERIAALIASCINEAHRSADHAIEIDAFGLVEFSRVVWCNQPDGSCEVLCTGLRLLVFASVGQLPERSEE